MFGVTFDDGPTPASSALIDFLQEQDQKSTHFVIGGNIVNNEAREYGASIEDTGASKTLG